MKLMLAGQERELDFSRSGFMEHIEDATGVDPIEFLESLKAKKQEDGKFKLTAELKTLAVFVYAGYNSHLDVEGKPNVDFATVRRWVRVIPTADLVSVMNKFYAEYAGESTVVVDKEKEETTGE